MDQAARYTAEHTVMDANLEIGKLKHLLKIAEDRIESYLKENKQLINEGLAKEYWGGSRWNIK